MMDISTCFKGHFDKLVVQCSLLNNTTDWLS